MAVGKYDVPSINLGAPLGTSIFQLVREREFADQNFDVLNKKYLENLKAQQKKLKPEEKDLKFIEEPRPGASHVICAVCREQFKDYYEHIFSQKHRRGVSGWSQIFNEIDRTIKDVAAHQDAKRLKQLYKIMKKTDGGDSASKNSNCVINPEDKPHIGNGEDNSSGSAINSKTTATHSDNELVGAFRTNRTTEENVVIDLDQEDSPVNLGKRSAVAPA